MNSKALLFLILPFFISCSAQKEQVVIDVVQLDSLLEDPLLNLQIKDYNLEGLLLDEFEILINEEGLYQYKDSVLVTAEMEIWLHKFSKPIKDSIADCEVLPVIYGYLKGTIIEGKREGEWSKRVKTSLKSDYVIVKTFQYTNGILDGKYQVFNTSGKALFYLEPHPLYLDEYKDFVLFKNGTGIYYDYYYETGVLKETGFYKNNKKNGAWVLFDENGNEVKREYYSNGILIN